MGSGSVRNVPIKKSELLELCKMTSMKADLIIKLYSYFNYFSRLIMDDGYINYEEFLRVIDRNNNILAQHLFRALDTNQDGRINFREFLRFFSCFLNGTFNEHCETSFNIFCNPKTKTIDSHTIKLIIYEGLKFDKVLSSYIDEEVISSLISNTFKNYTKELTSVEYKAFLIGNPEVLNWFKLDFSRVKEYGKPQKHNSCL